MVLQWVRTDANDAPWVSATILHVIPLEITYKLHLFFEHRVVICLNAESMTRLDVLV